MGGEGFCRWCFPGESIAQRSRTVHELDDREVLGLQIRGTTGVCADTYTWAGWLHFGCTYRGMHASHTFRWNVGFIGLAEHMSLLCFVLAFFGLFWPTWEFVNWRYRMIANPGLYNMKLEPHEMERYLDLDPAHTIHPQAHREFVWSNQKSIRERVLWWTNGSTLSRVTDAQHLWSVHCQGISPAFWVSDHRVFITERQDG